MKSNALSVINSDMESIRETQSASYELQPKTVRELVAGFHEDLETGEVVAFGGKLVLSPPWQREYVYGRKQAQAVIETIINNAPLSNMYWTSNTDGSMECLDGRQRSQSICQFVDNQWAVKFRGNSVTFNGLPTDIKERILNYELQVYEVKGKTKSKDTWVWTQKIQCQCKMFGFNTLGKRRL